VVDGRLLQVTITSGRRSDNGLVLMEGCPGGRLDDGGLCAGVGAPGISRPTRRSRVQRVPEITGSERNRTCLRGRSVTARRRSDGLQDAVAEAQQVQIRWHAVEGWAALDRGRTLRTALGIKGSPLLESRKVRNALEHFDDRLDLVGRWATTSAAGGDVQEASRLK